MEILSHNEKCAIVVAPAGSDAKTTVNILQKAGFDAKSLSTLASAAEQIQYGCGLIILTEEALNKVHQAVLNNTLQKQAQWSSIPVVLITSLGIDKLRNNLRSEFDPRVHITLLERPLRVATLLATVEVALATRQQQYEIRDLLEERQKLLNSLEQKVVERTAKLQVMMEEMEAFSYSVSHDLRSPLRVIDGYAEALREDYEASLPEPAQNLLLKISGAAKRMDRLTQDLLAYTRIASTALPPESVNLDQVMNDVLESYPSLMEVQNSIHIRHPLGHIRGHGPSLIQCFSNLLENAIKFVRSDVILEIHVWCEMVGDRVRVNVSDNGVGIDQNQQGRIFGLFERAGYHSVPGTGIGLAIVKKSVERMNGKVGVQSSLGKGSTFWVELAKGDL